MCASNKNCRYIDDDDDNDDNDGDNYGNDDEFTTDPNLEIISEDSILHLSNFVYNLYASYFYH